MNNSMERKGFQILKDKGSVAADALDRVFKESENSSVPFSQLLVSSGLVRESDLLQLYSTGFGIAYVNLKSVEIDKEIISKVPVKVASYYKFFPLALKGNRLTVAVSRLMDVNLLDEIKVGLGCDVDIVFARTKDVEEMLQRHYGLGADTVDRLTQSGSRTQSSDVVAETTEIEDLETLPDQASVVQLVNQIILDAYKKHASDIHLEPLRGRVRLRYRIDGVLHEAPVPDALKKFFMSILSRIKIMANLNIVERRLPQDGKARVKTHDQNLDLRISSIPTSHGESMVIRILPGTMVHSIEELGLDEDQKKMLASLLVRPNGIIFVTGPTGSGKSTTLYAGLNVLNTSERKIITIEDPVEYELSGVTQIQVSPDVGLTFAQGLRSVLRHDPDVMMVGEVRDLETADIAIRAALTGHLIFSTLHTNDASSGVTRLLDIGVEPFLVASSVGAFIAQRLVRVICAHCKDVDKTLSDEVQVMMRNDLGLDASEPLVCYRGMGCDDCNDTGFMGRVAIYEFITVDDAISPLIFSRASAEEIKSRAMSLGMKTLRVNGWQKVLAGITTADEIVKVTPPDRRFKRDVREIDRAAVMPEAADSVGEVIAIQSAALPARRKSDPSIERRAYQRLKTRLPILYRRVDAAKEQKRAEASDADAEAQEHTRDISANGIGFLAREKLEPGETLELKIRIPDGGEEIQCIGRVVRVTPESTLANFSSVTANMIGLTFLAINSTDRSRLERFCKENPVDENV